MKRPGNRKRMPCSKTDQSCEVSEMVSQMRAFVYVGVLTIDHVRSENPVNGLPQHGKGELT